MADKIGEVEISVNFDGDRLPIQARQIARQIGEAFDREFSGVSSRFDALADDIISKSRAISAGVDGIRFDRVVEDIGELRQVSTGLDATDRQIRRLAITTKDYSDAVIVVQENGRALSDSLVRVGDAAGFTGPRIHQLEFDIDDIGAAFAGAASFAASFAGGGGGGGGGGGLGGIGRSIDGLTPKWKDLSHNTRQWTLIIGSAIAGMDDMAVLGSAAGAGLTVLGSALTSTIIGAGTTVAAFSGLNGELSALPVGVREAASAFQGLSVPLKSLQDAIQVAAIGDSAAAWESLGNTIRGLQPAFEVVGRSIGRLIDDLATNLAPGTEAFNELFDLVSGSGPIFERVATIAGNLGVALIRAFNGAGPYVEEFLGWVDDLVREFDRFTRSSGLDEWYQTASRVFGSIGHLLDEVGSALNDAVDEDAVNRLTGFVDSLAGAIPLLSSIVDFAGELDVFGLAANALEMLGSVLGPVLQALAPVASILSTIASAIMDVVGILGSFLAPVIGVVTFAMEGINLVFEKVSAWVQPAVNAFADVGRALSDLGSEVWEQVEPALSDLMDALLDLLPSPEQLAAIIREDVIPMMRGFAVIMANVVVPAIEGMATGLKVLGQTMGNWSDEWEWLKDNAEAVASAFVGFATAANPVIGIISNLAFGSSGLARDLGDLSGPINDMAKSDLPEAQRQFTEWADSVGASDEEVLNLINKMPQFKEALTSASLASGGLASDQELVALALSGTGGAARTTASDLSVMDASVEESDRILAGLEGRAYTTGDQIDQLSAKILGFGSAQLDVREASREFEAALAAVTESVALNGTSLEINTEQGRANEAALDAVAQSSLELAAATAIQTGNHEAANAVIAEGRTRLIEMLAQFGITGAAADDYVNRLGLIPDNVYTAAALLGVPEAEAQLAQLARDRHARIMVQQIYYDENRNYAKIPGLASGGTLYGPQHILAGEAGPEAIVPLNRPLSQVEPSVRWLSAIAQGLTPMAAGGVVGGGKQVNFGPGSIVVQEADDASATALGVVTRIVERVAG